MEEPIVNRVARSALITLDLADFYHPGERLVYDLAQNLYQGLILKEKDFRAFVKEHDWSAYAGKNVALTCTAEAIIPTWAYMLLASALTPHAHLVVFGTLEQLEQALFQQALSRLNPEDYRDQRVVIKGCGEVPVPEYAYVEITRLLRPVVKSLMYGEPCSTVPVFKRK